MNPIDFERIKNIPSFKAFYNQVKGINFSDMDYLKNCLEHLAQSNFINSLVNYELDLIQETNEYVPMYGNFNFLNLIDNSDYSLSLLYKTVNQDFSIKYLANYPSDQIICSLSPHGIYYNLYKQTQTDNREFLDQTKRLSIACKNELLEFGKAIIIESKKDVISFSNEHPQLIIAFIMSSKKMNDLTWEFDSKTLIPERIVAGTQTNSRIEFTSLILGHLGNPSSIPILFSLLNHKSHHVRWEAARSIIKINLIEGEKALLLLINDENKEIRELSAKNLISLKKQLTKI